MSGFRGVLAQDQFHPVSNGRMITVNKMNDNVSFQFILRFPLHQSPHAAAMSRPTIPELAQASGVSVSTVNRVINGSTSVRQATRERVLAAAKQVGFYGLVAIEQSVADARVNHRLKVLLPPRSRLFYRDLGEALARSATNFPRKAVEMSVEHLDDPVPEQVAERLRRLARDADSIAFVGAQHPLIIDAVDDILRAGIPVTALIAPLTADGDAGFVGLDNWSVGRTAGWAFNKMVREPGEVGILVGSHRYRNQDLNESGFRSYFREHNQEFTLLEPLSTYESASVAHERVQQLLVEHPDMCGLLVSGGGITGALTALRDTPHRKDFVTVGYELFDTTRTALLDGTLTLAIAHPIDALARAAIDTMVDARSHRGGAGARRIVLEFDVYTSENIGKPRYSQFE